MPTAMRPVGIASAYIMQHILIIILVQFTPIAIEMISWRFFLIFVCSSAVSFIVFVLFYPETRNKTLEELAAVFGDEVCKLPTHFLAGLTLCRLPRHWMKLASVSMRKKARGAHMLKRSRRKNDLGLEMDTQRYPDRSRMNETQGNVVFSSDRHILVVREQMSNILRYEG